MNALPRGSVAKSFAAGVPLAALCLLASCGGSSSAAPSASTTSSSTTNAYTAAYQALNWASGVSVTYSGSCSMTVTSSGTPPSHNAYYLAPAGTGQAAVATTPSGIQLAVIPYSGSGISSVSKVSATFNICPSKAASTTATSGGAIGLISSGEVLFDSYEATNTVALGDNASYTFTSAGTSYTAYFIDQCNSHPTGAMGNSGSTWHYHGAPVCYTPTVDGASGPSHIIGIALDGYPIYGGRDINGNVIDPSKLDACNGITSATPEFPSGAYHYVLPITSSGTAVTTKQSSINCYAGSVSATLSAQMRKLACNMPGMQMAHNMPAVFVPQPLKPEQKMDGSHTAAMPAM